MLLDARCWGMVISRLSESLWLEIFFMHMVNLYLCISRYSQQLSASFIHSFMSNLSRKIGDET